MEKTSALDVKKALALGVLDIHSLQQRYHEFAVYNSERSNSDMEEYSRRMELERNTREQAIILIGKIINNHKLLDVIADALNKDIPEQERSEHEKLLARS